MNERIERLVKAVRSGEIFPECVKVEYDEFDLKLADQLRIAKRLSEYMEAQSCAFTDDNELLGLMRFDGSVEAALFPRIGHRFFKEAKEKLYCKPQENLCTMAELLDALDADWKGYEELRTKILRKGKFFGNNDPLSNDTAHRFYGSVYDFAKDRTDIFGNHLDYGNLTGYNPHFAWFGAMTPATPDGRYAGSALLFGGGQSDGKDRDGMTSLLLSVAHMDPTGIMCGDSILNLSVDEATVRDEESFGKLVVLIETYFKEGGLHVQLNYVAAEDLIAAKQAPDRYKSLRVRVSGFSATFVDLTESIQDDVIARTVNPV